MRKEGENLEKCRDGRRYSWKRKTMKSLE